ncbi:protein mono-ADP-ribosyltransferase PARP12-like [Ptychodera flava]|uniref:protein mono-ADP-ribosyltransferase PARP12-like n=1 Tax=Ptychodera flava TaxID=63121 RepID=UPI00396A1453
MSKQQQRGGKSGRGGGGRGSGNQTGGNQNSRQQSNGGGGRGKAHGGGGAGGSSGRGRGQSNHGGNPGSSCGCSGGRPQSASGGQQSKPNQHRGGGRGQGQPGGSGRGYHPQHGTQRGGTSNSSGGRPESAPSTQQHGGGQGQHRHHGHQPAWKSQSRSPHPYVQDKVATTKPTVVVIKHVHVQSQVRPVEPRTSICACNTSTASTGAIPKTKQQTQDSNAGIKKTHPSPGLATTKGSANTDREKKYICLDNLMGRCNYKRDDQCRFYHYGMPYIWQKRSSPENWELFPDEISFELERRFCDVNTVKTQISDGSSKLMVDYNKMIAINLEKKEVTEIRRLSTPSTRTGDNTLAVDWLWYWKDGTVWRIYGEQGGEGSATIRSADIEEKYSAFKEKNDPLTLPFSVGLETDFDLNFGQMVQINRETMKKRDVRRRPNYLSPDFVDHAKKRVTSKKIQQQEKKKPAFLHIFSAMKNWDKTAHDKGGYSLALLSENGDTSAEYGEVASRFRWTMPHDVIVSIERVQNKSLWGFFEKRYEDMKQKASDGRVNVRHLFHGTDEDYVDVICRQNFDWRLCGSRIGTKFGKGSYFAKTARFSDGYIQTHDVYQKMFLARVLVGEFTKGHKELVKPPPKNANDPLGDLYDSCVNNVNNPSTYVIFESSQVYPEYIITYIRNRDMDDMETCLSQYEQLNLIEEEED